ncbi:MAG: MerR family transcriptional regulator [Actinomycetota bacterium]
MTSTSPLALALEAALDADGTVSIESLHDLTVADDVGPLGIAEMAERAGVSAHTLRYYERIGLLDVARDGAGHRRYDAAAVRRVVFLTRMRLSGMAISDLQTYVDLVDQGDATIPDRLDMLLEHRDTLRGQIRQLQLSLATTEFKIATYGGETQP